MNAERDVAKAVETQATSTANDKSGGLLLLAVLTALVLCSIPWLLYYTQLLRDAHGKVIGFGDTFEAFNSLFAGLALAGVVVAIFLQKRDLSMQRQELRRQSVAQEKSELALGEQVQSMRTQAEALSAQVEYLARPYVMILVRMRHDTLRELHISNSGRSPAENLSLTIDRDFHFFGMLVTDDVRSLAESHLFKNTIPIFAPGTEVFFPLATGDKLRESSVDDERMPLVFTITSVYSFGGKSYREVHQIDLRLFHNSLVQSEFHLKALIEIDKDLKSIDKRLTEIKGKM